jgi:energy-coupling factor transport system permease protein
MLLGLLLLFALLNRVLPAYELVRLAPPALHDLGIVILIALTYVPETLRHWERIREAQAIRGHRLRGLREWRPLVIPLLVGGLERAMGLAEVMVARGYGAEGRIERPAVERALLLAALVAFFGGWLVTFWYRWIGMVMMAGAVGMLWWWLRRSGRPRPSRYQFRAWRPRDFVVLAAAALPLAVAFLPLLPVDRAALSYSPYPELLAPLFDPLLGLATLGLAAPAVLEAA